MEWCGCRKRQRHGENEFAVSATWLLKPVRAVLEGRVKTVLRPTNARSSVMIKNLSIVETSTMSTYGRRPMAEPRIQQAPWSSNNTTQGTYLFGKGQSSIGLFVVGNVSLASFLLGWSSTFIGRLLGSRLLVSKSGKCVGGFHDAAKFCFGRCLFCFGRSAGHCGVKR